MKKLVTIFAVCVILFAAALCSAEIVTPITFAPGDYDNTVNTVTGTNAAPIYNNNQTTGKFRDIFWWGLAYNGGTQGVGSPDFINRNPHLVSNGGSPARAIVGPSDVIPALNFTGLKTTSSGASFLTIYDTTVADGTATKNLFDASIGTGIEVSADVLFTPGQHNASAGVVALYNEGQDALALLATNNGGNNPDVPKVSLIWQANGTGITLTSTSLPFGTFLGDTVGSDPYAGDHWYRVVMNLSVTGDTWNMVGTFFPHVTASDPSSALGSLITTLPFSGSLSDPDSSLRILTNPGEVGLIASTTANFNDGVATGWTGADPHVDNVGVSITNFQVVPEPATLMLLGLGALSLLRKRRA